MAVDGAIKEKKKKKKLKKDGVGATAKNGGTQDITEYQHASVQTTIKTEQSEVNICKGEQHEYDTTEKKKKKKKKIKEVNEYVAVYHDVSVKTPVKTELLEINSNEGGLEKSDLPQKEKKKKRKKESEHLQENVMEVTNSEPGEKIDGECLEESMIKKKRKKEKGKKQMEESATEAGEIKKKKKKDVEVKEEVDAGHSGKKKKKKRKNIEDEEQIPESGDGEVKKKRKKTEKHIKTVESDAEPTKKRKKKEQNASLKTENNKEMKVKVNKEKLSLVEDEMNETDVNTEKRSKKKKKRLENLDEGQRLVNGTKAKTGDVTGEIRSSKHKMKKGIKLEVDDVIEEERQENKMSKQDENKSTEKKDVVFLSARPGNQDEISIDQARRLALQEDIDKESQPKPNLGQWSTAQFDSSDKQAKFMRLMGGFKKSSQPDTGSSGHANMSLGKEGQQTLQQGLLGEFERAQSRHLDFRNKGIGFGFTPPSNKKFAIDVNARNSIRFDD